MTKEQIHFVTGRLAERALRDTVADIAPRAGFDYSVDVLGITVAALMTPQWIARRVSPPATANRIIVPGYCVGDLGPIEEATGKSVERGPRDLKRLPEYFGEAPAPDDYGAHDIEIIAEINHCPRKPLAEILHMAKRLADDGADVIDVGCDPGDTWDGVGETVRALREQGHRVSVDSMNPREIENAVRHGAELVLSVNGTNCRPAADWGCEVVAVPDDPGQLRGLDRTIEYLDAHRVPYRIDPVLEPIGFGLAASLSRYVDVRRRYPNAPMMMGIGNLTELTDVDSAGINVVLLGICQETNIKSVLTTQVINWARTSVAECHLARKLVYYACRQRVLPKHLEPGLIMLRGAEPVEIGSEEMDRLAATIKDHNFRIFAERGQVHVVSASMHLHDEDPFRLFHRVLQSRAGRTGPAAIDPQHAFYLGYEMCKAVIALQLGKPYTQDEALDWGMLTVAEPCQLAGRDSDDAHGRDQRRRPG